MLHFASFKRKKSFLKEQLNLTLRKLNFREACDPALMSSSAGGLLNVLIGDAKESEMQLHPKRLVNFVRIRLRWEPPGFNRLFYPFMHISSSFHWCFFSRVNVKFSICPEIHVTSDSTQLDSDPPTLRSGALCHTPGIFFLGMWIQVCIRLMQL